MRKKWFACNPYLLLRSSDPTKSYLQRSTDRWGNLSQQKIPNLKKLKQLQQPESHLERWYIDISLKIVTEQVFSFKCQFKVLPI